MLLTHHGAVHCRTLMIPAPRAIKAPCLVAAASETPAWWIANNKVTTHWVTCDSAYHRPSLQGRKMTRASLMMQRWFLCGGDCYTTVFVSGAITIGKAQQIVLRCGVPRLQEHVSSCTNTLQGLLSICIHCHSCKVAPSAVKVLRHGLNKSATCARVRMTTPFLQAACQCGSVPLPKS